jgi:hypothetical protein
LPAFPQNFLRRMPAKSDGMLWVDFLQFFLLLFVWLFLLCYCWVTLL